MKKYHVFRESDDVIPSDPVHVATVTAKSNQQAVEKAFDSGKIRVCLHQFLFASEILPKKNHK